MSSPGGGPCEVCGAKLVAPIVLSLATAACGDARHEPVRVIAQPRAVPASAPPLAPSAPVPPLAPPVRVSAASAAALPARGLDAPRPAASPASAVEQRWWQPGEPNGNAEFRAALEGRGQR